jgi:hypothetical protein
MILKDRKCEVVGQIYLPSDQENWRAPVNTIMKLCVPHQTKNFSNDWQTISFQRKIPPRSWLVAVKGSVCWDPGVYPRGVVLNFASRSHSDCRFNSVGGPPSAYTQRPDIRNPCRQQNNTVTKGGEFCSSCNLLDCTPMPALREPCCCRSQTNARQVSDHKNYLAI